MASTAPAAMAPIDPTRAPRRLLALAVSIALATAAAAAAPAPAGTPPSPPPVKHYDPLS